MRLLTSVFVQSEWQVGKHDFCRSLSRGNKLMDLLCAQNLFISTDSVFMVYWACLYCDSATYV